MTEQPPFRIGIIGGTGVEEALTDGSEGFEAPETPFGPPAAPIALTEWAGVPVAVLRRHGPGHPYNPTHVPYRANIFALKRLGVTHIVATGATGSLAEDVHPGELVLVDQVIDRTYRRAPTFFEHAACHVELSEPFCPVTRGWLRGAAEGLEGTRAHDGGTYVCMEGPSFSTRAESHMHRLLGGHVIGMTCMPEARLAREAEIAYAMVALPTDYDCWKPHAAQSEEALLEEIGKNLAHASEKSIDLIKAALSDTSPLETPSPAHDALRLALWSDKSRIDPAEIERLRPLWGRHFPQRA